MSAGQRAVGLLEALDQLFANVVLDPQVWDERAFADWMEANLGNGEGLDREAVKIVTRAVRRAQRLQRYWVTRPDGPGDWQMRVDETLGSSGWRPGLELAEWGMAIDPDPELFEEMAERFRAVNFTPLSISFEEWMESRPPTADGRPTTGDR
jgi:hypothetical protein